MSAWAASIPGDVDKDGDVDFNDFVLLAKNFGKTGSSVWPQDATPQERAQALLGFWVFNVPTEDRTFEFLMGHIQDNEGDISVTGTDAYGVIVGGYYQPDTEQFLIVQSLLTEQYFFSFSIDDPDDARVTGKVSKWVYDEDKIQDLGVLGIASGKFITDPSSFTIHVPPTQR
jgi:hypothetical protein